jgi:hypothetical protein
LANKPPALTKAQRAKLAEIEPRLRACACSADFDEAKKLVAEVQPMLRSTGHTTRLLQIKNWLYECALEARELDFAIAGFEGNRKLARSNTRIYLEATAFLAICYLRQKNVEKAKFHVREAIVCVSNIQTPRRREQFHKRYLGRLEEECVLSGLIEETPGYIDVDILQDEAVKLLKEKHEDEIIEQLGMSLLGQSAQLLLDVQGFYHKQLPVLDRKMLPAPVTKHGIRELGQKVSAAFKRVAWRAVCDSKSDLYKAWSTNAAYVYDGKVLIGALAAALKSWKITAMCFAAAMTALIIKWGAAVFCEAFVPDWLMIHVTEKD